MRKSISLLMLILFLCLVVATPHTIDTTKIAINSFINALFPSLFLILVLSKLLYYYGVFNSLYNHLPKILKSLYFPLLAIIFGFSGNAVFLNTNQELSDNNKKHLIYCFNLPSFSFTIFTLGYLLQDYFASSILFSIQVLAALILFFRKPLKLPKYLPAKNTPIKECLSKAIIESGVGLYIMLAYIIIISAISAMISNELWVNGLLEFSSSTLQISASNLPLVQKLIAITIILGFGSISSHLQVFNLIELNLNYLTFYFYRLLQTILSLIILFFFLIFLF